MLCSVIMLHSVVRAVLTSQSTGSDFDLLGFAPCLPRTFVSLVLCIFNFFVTFLALPFDELSLLGLALDLVD